jgi:hypothetical protein
MKNGLDHLVPLSDEVLDILAQVRTANADLRDMHPDKLRPDVCCFLMRSTHRAAFRMSRGRTPYGALGTSGGCRRMVAAPVFATGVPRIGKFQDDAIERQLAHVERNKTRARLLAPSICPNEPR